MEKPERLEQKAGEWAILNGRQSMANDNRPTRDKPSKSTPDQPVGSSERPFDKWLRKQLHAMYDDIASEPLPDNLLKLIETDAGAAKDSKSPKK